MFIIKHQEETITCQSSQTALAIARALASNGGTPVITDTSPRAHRDWLETSTGPYRLVLIDEEQEGTYWYASASEALSKAHQWLSEAKADGVSLHISLYQHFRDGTAHYKGCWGYHTEGSETLLDEVNELGYEANRLLDKQSSL